MRKPGVITFDNAGEGCTLVVLRGVAEWPIRIGIAPRIPTYPHVSPGALHYSIGAFVLGILLVVPSAIITRLNPSNVVFTVLFWAGFSVFVAGTLLFAGWFGLNLRARQTASRR